MAKKPELFYRYRSANNLKFLKEILLENKIHFAAPNTFNDPFEFYSYIQQPTFLDFKEYVSKTPGKLSELKNVPNTGLKAAFRTTILEKFRSIYKEGMDEVRSSCGVLCLSSDPLSINLWSHYGDHHKGVCFEFRNMKGSIFNHSTKVQYVKKPAKINYFYDILQPEFNLFDKILPYKFDGAWGQESEYRLLVDKFGHYEFPKNALIKIFLGAKFNNPEFLKVLKTSRPELTIVKLKLHEYEYKLLPEYTIKAKHLSNSHMSIKG